MSKFHIGANGPAPCKAHKSKCPLGGVSGSENHYSTMEEATAAYDKSNESKKIAKPLTKSKSMGRGTAKDMDLNTYRFIKINGSNFPGGTISEYREYLNNLKSKYPDYLYMNDESIRNEVYQELGVNNINDEGFNAMVEFDSKDNKLKMIFTDFSGPIDEFGTTTSEDFENYGELTSTPYYLSSNAESLGYYGEELEYTFNYKLDEEKHEALIKKLNDYEELNMAKPQLNRMNADNLPEWAALPVSQMENGGGEHAAMYKKFTEEYLKNPDFTPSRTKILEAADFNKTSLKRLKETAEADGESIKKAVDRRDSSAQRSKKIEKLISQIKDEDLLNKRKVAGDGVKYRSWESPRIDNIEDFKKLDKPHKEKALERLQNELTITKNMHKNAETKIENLQKLNKSTIDKAKKEYSQRVAENNEKIKENTIERLSYLYPSSDRATRLKNAEEWVNNNPKIIGQPIDLR